MNKVLVSPDFLKVLFFFTGWVGLCDIVARLAAAPRQLRLLWRYPPRDFFLRPKKTEPATQATLETAQLNRELLKGQLGASLLFRKLRIGHTRVLG